MVAKSIGTCQVRCTRQKAEETMRRLSPPAVIAAVLAALLLPVPPAGATPHAGLTLLDSAPSANAVIAGTSQNFSVSFDDAIRADAARLLILRDGKVIRRLRPQQDSDTHKVFANLAAPLPPGDYVLRWHVVGAGRQVVKNGDIPFTVRAP
jgi:methionine-rich copper-binding protein CopC